MGDTSMTRLIRRVLSVAAVLVSCLVSGSLASAQTPAMNPTGVVFTPSADHALLTGYEFGYFAVGAADPVQTVTKTLAQLTAEGTDYTFPFPRLLFGTYDVKLRACANAVCSTWASSDRSVAVSPLPPGVVTLR
jgi:hypothetical protein